MQANLLGISAVVAIAAEQTVVQINSSAVVSCAGASRALLNMGMAAGRAMGGTKGPLRGWRQAALSKILAAGDSLRLQFPREDLGYIYDEPDAAVIPEDTSAPAGETLRILPGFLNSNATAARSLCSLPLPHPWWILSSFPGFLNMNLMPERRICSLCLLCSLSWCSVSFSCQDLRQHMILEAR